MDQHNPVSRLNALGRLNDIVRGCCHLIMAASFLVFVCATPGLADEERLERADQNREEARVRAESQLGYPYVFRDSRDRHVDFLSLAAQISALSRLIDQMAVTGAGSQIAPPPTVPLAAGLARSAPSTLTREAYGPEGPTIKSVRLIAEYQLLKNGNKRLKLGDVKDLGDTLSVDIITQDGSLVERYSINKKTGNWLPVEDP